LGIFSEGSRQILILIFLNFGRACAKRNKRVVIINVRRNLGRDSQNAGLSHRKDAIGLDKASGIPSASFKHLQEIFTMED
jgi:hypothetical protein